MNKINIKNLGLDELSKKFHEMGLQGYRADQVIKWLYQRQVGTFGEMTNIKKELKEDLERCFTISQLAIKEVRISEDGTKKYLIGLADGMNVESVLIPKGTRNTLCISSQVGCAMDCRFCLTATMGLLRNLTVFEIVDQVGVVVRDLHGASRISNIVFMGMGEPLANTRNLYRSIQILLHPFCYGFSRNHVTVSTSGLAPQIEKFGDETPVKLAVSLNATTDQVRDRIMPINKRYPIDRLVEALRRMHLPKRNRVTFEYVMLHGVNDSLEDAGRLVGILSHLKAKINLIPFNEFHGSDFKRPPDEWVLKFQKVLLNKGFVANVRHSRGRDILGACGQLATDGR